jgi:hypothetical protein
MSSKNYATIYGTEIPYYRIKNDNGGIGRYVVHFLSLGLEDHKSDKFTKKIGKVYKAKKFGGGFVIQSCYLTADLKRYFRHKAGGNIENWINLNKREENPNVPDTFSNLLKVIKEDCAHTWEPSADITAVWRKEEHQTAVVARWLQGQPSTLAFDRYSVAEYMESWGLHCPQDDNGDVNESGFYQLVSEVILKTARLEDIRVLAAARRES